jgi:alcohol dehydrogenase
MAILLPHCMRFNLDACAPAYAELLLPLAGAEIYARTPAENRADAAIAAAEALLDVGAGVGLPRRLSEVGVLAEQLDAIARLALDDGSVAVNPRELTFADARAILEAAL